MTEPQHDERLPPQDLDAERAVLSAMLRTTTAIDDVNGLITDEDFYKPAHQAIYRAIVAVYNEGGRPDPVVVGEKLGKDYDRCGGAPYLFGLFEGNLPTSNADFNADLVSGKAALRRLSEAAQHINQLVFNGGKGVDIDRVLDTSRAAVDEATASYRNRGHHDGAWIGDLAEHALTRYAEPTLPGLSTGWKDVDTIFSGGLKPGQFIVIGARTGVGKSVVGINLAVEAARAGQGVVFASLEMDRDEITDRVIAQVASVELGALTRHALSEDEWNRVRLAAVKLRDVPLRVEDASSLSLARLRSLARDQKRHPAGLGLIVADYLQLLNGADPRVPREQQVAQFSRELKLLAKEMHVPVVALSQLNRQSEQRADKRPTKADLRESGSIEQDADIIVLLWMDPSEEHIGEIAFIVDKNRQGRTADVYLSWAPHYARARSLYSA